MDNIVPDDVCMEIKDYLCKELGAPVDQAVLSVYRNEENKEWNFTVSYRGDCAKASVRRSKNHYSVFYNNMKG